MGVGLWQPDGWRSSLPFAPSSHSTVCAITHNLSVFLCAYEMFGGDPSPIIIIIITL